MVLKSTAAPLPCPGSGDITRMANIRVVLADLVTPENQKPEFLNINPASAGGSDRDFKLSESHAILTYVHATRRTEDTGTLWV